MIFNPDQRNLGGRCLITSQVFKHKIQLQQIQKQPLTERRQIFFRRVPSPTRDRYAELLHKRPLSFQSKPKTPSKKRISVIYANTPRETQLKIIPPNSSIDWDALLDELTAQKSLDKLYLKKLSVKYQIFADNDYAILVRLMMQTFPNLSQQSLVDIFAEIIEELER